jgi:hypothetical protein
VDCSQRQDSILLYAAGDLEGDEAADLRAHLATGCPQCAGALAQADAILAQMALAVEPTHVPETVKQRLMMKIGKPHAIAPPQKTTPPPNPRGSWERVILPASIAAIFAVAITLAAVWKFLPPSSAPTNDSRDQQIAALERMLAARATQTVALTGELNAANRRASGMQVAKLTGEAQPSAVGRVFIDGKNGKWYFFTSGMTHPQDGKVYELWVICRDQKIPAGTFDVTGQGCGMLLGTVPCLPSGASITLAVTDEPAGGVKSPTGNMQIAGIVQ